MCIQICKAPRSASFLFNSRASRRKRQQKTVHVTPIYLTIMFHFTNSDILHWDLLSYHLWAVSVKKTKTALSDCVSCRIVAFCRPPSSDKHHERLLLPNADWKRRLAGHRRALPSATMLSFSLWVLRGFLTVLGGETGSGWYACTTVTKHTHSFRVFWCSVILLLYFLCWGLHQHTVAFVPWYVPVFVIHVWNI